jgi:hypothetical protein
MDIKHMFFNFNFNVLANSINRWAHADKSYCSFAFAFCADRAVEVLPDSESSIGGSSFVDISLKVVVQQDTGTVLAFMPEKSS